MNLTVIAIVFGVIFLAELPDKSLFASLVLGTRYRPLPVWVGVAAAFAVHVVIAVVAGHALTLLPERVVESVVALLFAVGAGVMLFGKEEAESSDDEVEQARSGPPARSSWAIVLTSFTVIFVGEWGDITQIATANYAARYGDPIAVGVGALAGLWAVSGLAVTAGNRIVERVPLPVVRRVAGVILLVFAVLAVVSVIRG